MKQSVYILFIAITLFFNAVQSGYAEELTITGNGDGSANEVSVQTETNANVSQSNDANVTNDVAVSENTGDNSASDNTGDQVTVQTGDASSDVQIANAMINTSVVSQDACCQTPLSAEISGNGSNSQNTVTVTTSTTQTANVSNTATITNNVQGSANTGGNNANDNTGNVSILTGSITVNELIKNGPVNLTYLSLSGGSEVGGTFKIHGNGTGSTNTITFTDRTLASIFITNEVVINNKSIWDLTTGNNTADGNTGDVKIATGDITVRTKIENGPINVSIAKINLCCKEQPHQPENPPTPPQKPPKPGDGGGGNGGGKGGDGGKGDGGSSSAGAAGAGQILPITGSYLFFMILANIIMLFFGVLLRLRSGRSPGYASYR